ncbi:MAG: HRDC domain-containing protein [Deltaproteobacteria bacterium]|nr:HRDC domain-containing protein [Deltaproteobacteria bacterium]
MPLHFDVVDRPAVLREISQILAREKVIAFDTEFIRESTYLPKLALVQVATREDAWLLDVVSMKAVDMEPFLAVLRDPNILKVVHSAHGDQECLFHTYGMTASPILDTFEAASLLGMGESVSLRDLIRMELKLNVGKSHARTDWLRRPISEELKKYALSDVQYLVEIGERMLERLETLNRKKWAFELSAYYENHQLYADNSEEIAHRLAKSGRISARSFAILRDLVSWREKRARALNIPRRRVADDETLFHIANARPTSIEQLGKFRGINSGEIQRHGKDLLDIIQAHVNKPNDELPEAPKPSIPNPAQARVVDVLGTYLRVLSEQLEIASRHLLTAAELRKIVLENLLDPKQWVEKGLCSAQVADLIGEDLTAMLEGRRVLSIANGKIKIQEL